jgi:hypothetical protein
MFDVENGWSSKISRWCLDFISATTCELTEAGNESGPGWLVRYNHQSVSIPIFTSLPISSRRCNTSLSDQQANDILQRNTNPNPSLNGYQDQDKTPSACHANQSSQTKNRLGMKTTY